MKLEEVEKLQNDIEILMKKYVDSDGNIKHWKVQSIAGSIVKNLIIQRVINLVCPKCGNTGRCEPRTLSDPDGQECDCGQTCL